MIHIDKYAFDERAAIFEYEAGMTREEAEQCAMVECLRDAIEAKLLGWVFTGSKTNGKNHIRLSWIEPNTQISRVDEFTCEGLSCKQDSTTLTSLR